MRYVLIFFSLLPIALMVYLWFLGGDIFNISSAITTTSATSKAIAISDTKLFLFAKIAAHATLWILLLAFWVEPLKQYLRLDLVEFKEMLSAFAIFYALLHIVLLSGAYGFDFAKLTKLATMNPSYISGLFAAIIMLLASLIKSWRKIIYIGVVFVIVHLLVATGLVKTVEIIGVSLFALALALRLI